jgi:catechol 2,3-dioxygenase-like lactoylglutathione lyase family enzyme
VRTLTLVIFLGLLFVLPSTARPQSAPAGDIVIGSGNFSPIVQDLGKSLAFYTDLLGATPPATPSFSNTDTALLNFLGVPTAQIRFSTVRIPGSTMGVEIVEFKDIDRKAMKPRPQDPGATMLILFVRDLDVLLSRLKAAGTPFVTAGGTPVSIPAAGISRGIVVKDPDGFHIALLQPDPLPQTTAPANSNVIGARVALTVEDLDQTLRLYRDVLGFQVQDNEVLAAKPVLDLLNTPGAQIRRASAGIPGSAIQMEFLEFKGIDRKPIGARIQDPGATRFQLRVRDTDAAVKILKTQGGQVITTGGDGGPINMRNLRVALVRELNNLFLVIMSQPPAAR